MAGQESWASQYDLFEIDGGYRTWRTQVMGQVHAGFTLRELSAKSPNEWHAVHRSTNEVVARLEIPSPKARAPLLFQVAYDLAFADKLGQELPPHGYRFSYAAGNDLASAILTAPMECDAFILGHAAPMEIRGGMAAWLTANYLDVPIIALKSHSEPDLAVAHFNLELDGDPRLLPTITRALSLRNRTD